MENKQVKHTGPPRIWGVCRVFPDGAKSHEAAPPLSGLGEAFTHLVRCINPKISTQDLRSQMSFRTSQILKT